MLGWCRGGVVTVRTMINLLVKKNDVLPDWNSNVHSDG